MRRIMMLFVAMMLIGSGTAMGADLKIGLVNMQKLATQSEAAQVAQKKMKETFGAEKSALDKQAAELQKKGEAMQAQSAALSPEAKEDKKIEFLRLRRDFEEKARTFSRKVEAAEMRIRQEMADLIIQATNTYAKKKGYDLVLDGASAGVIHADKGMDITDDVLAEVNKLWRANKK